MTKYIDETFQKGGYLARAHGAGYEVRQGQIQLAEAVHQGMVGERHVLAEAPCGTGKGFAYAVPAIQRAAEHNAVTVIATANIALQTQLMRDDLPFLKRALPWNFTYELLKGRNNYACKYKIDQLDLLRSYGAFGNPGTKKHENYGLNDEQGEKLNALLAWSDVTDTGDREDPGCPVSSGPTWGKISVGANECLRGGCRFSEDCWAEKQKERAHGARIIVTNYNVLYAHFYVMAKTGNPSVLPAFDYLIMDEAHEAARIARDFFGATITYKRFKQLANFIETEMGLSELAKQLTKAAFQMLVDMSYYTKSDTYRRDGRLIGTTTGIDPTETDELLKQVQKAVSKLVTEFDGVGKAERQRIRKKAQAADVMHNHAHQLREDLEEALDKQDGGKVYWIDLRDKVGMPAAVESRPLDVATLLQKTVFTNVASATLTSATLTTGGTFDLIKAEMGLVGADTIDVIAPSPFDFARRSRLVIGSKKLPVPRSQNRQLYNEAMLPIYHEILDAWPGRTLCLFTAKTDLDFVHQSLAARPDDRQLFKQGEWPRNTLVDWFREAPSSILLGVDSFWTGVDVPEPKAIIIHKLPFPRLDIVNRAIQDQMGDAFFNERYLPWMITRLRQGIGRLIRRQSDYGFVVCLDRRGFDGGYAPAVRASLPFGPAWIRTDRLDMVQRFLATQAAAV